MEPVHGRDRTHRRETEVSKPMIGIGQSISAPDRKPAVDDSPDDRRTDALYAEA
jgi:hypothetical protein